MGLVVKPNTFTTGTNILASEVNSNFDTLYTLVNGNIESANLASGAVGESELAASAVTNAKVSASAAIALSKLAALTVNRAAVTDGSGALSASAVTATELGYLSGVTSGIQAQLDGKSSTSHNHAASDITSGTLGVARIPDLDAAKITTGTLDDARLSNTAFVESCVVNSTGAVLAKSSGIISVSRDSTGFYIITHNLGSLTAYSAVASAYWSVPCNVQVFQKANTCEVYAFNGSDGALMDAKFTFHMTRF